ncbi:uncharacterized protein FFB20_04743 [Fusarium fujikuroi]|uniref:DUF6604 domain-containing protein n=1 Tax=Fusarium fujikuroi TaxID=5127 RepID=A0A2H3RXG4_FUSFU|nr:hypothetical protein CEK25_007558 [Fusarium fujikuroi]SCN75146.1 uncharacterized protein FFB20_04743 [Fusarium fujikuroi]SCN89895.1 uncharacterized protein FFC1_05879 [Fusarium fujikuroi]SCN94072.1 uncharacterized protein FFE2_07972 [Fusarium fujikuroi]SCO41504.1 uncharacterized protein FFNC_07974 [Fusarium fujikuroi]
MAPSMLPYNLVSVLQLYKKDTDSVAGWLASKANHYGYKSQTAEPNDKEAQNKPSGRLKGKAGKEAKSQATEPKDKTDQKYIVALKDYVPMAKFIAAHRKPTIPVPVTVFNTIGRVIDRRSSFRAQMVKHGIEVDENANQNHLHFIRVMETVRETLRPNMKEVGKQKSAESAECWSGKHIDFQLSELLNSTFSHVLSILEPLITMFPRPTQSTFDTYEMMSILKTRCGVPGSDAATLNLSVDQLMAARFWNEALVFTTHRTECSVMDKFSSYVFESSEDHVMSFELAFALQVHLDVFHIMRDDLARGSSEFYKHAKDLRDQLQAFVTSLSRPGSPLGPPNVDESVCRLIQHLDKILVYCDPQGERTKPEKGTRSQGKGTFEIFEILPAFSGLYLFHARVDVADMALRLVKDAGVMTVMVHLHNAMEQLQMLKAPWVDTGSFQNCFEEHDLFFMAKPKKRSDFLKHVLIQLGCPPSIEATADNGADALLPLDSEERKKAKIRFTKPKSKDRQQTTQLSPDQQRRQFALALAGESRELAFPYIGMHNLCVSLFHNISDRCASTLDALDVRIDPLKPMLDVMLKIISLATAHEVVPLREAAEVIQEHINKTAIMTEKIANVGAFDLIPIPNFELYKIPRPMFIEVIAEPEEDEEITIPFEDSDSSSGEIEEIDEVPHEKVGEGSQSSVIQ